MRRIDVSERPMPEINPAKVCFIIEKARGLSSEDVGADPDASNPADDGERSILTGANASVRRELVQFIKDLDVDEAAALVALAWIGLGDFEPEEWKRAVAAGGRAVGGPDLEISSRHALAAGLPRRRALDVRPLLRGDRVGGGRAGRRRANVARPPRAVKAGAAGAAFCNLIERDLVPPPRSRV